MDRTAFYNWVQKRLWLWRLKALGRAVWRLALAALVVTPVAVLLLVVWFSVGTALNITAGPWLGSLLFVALFTFLVLKTIDGVRRDMSRRKSDIREAFLSADLSHVSAARIDALDAQDKAASAFAGLLGFALRGFFHAVARFCALMGMGAVGAGAVLEFLAERKGLVAFGEIADLFGEDADVERIIAGVAAIDGVVLALSGEPKGIAVASPLRARLLKAGHVCGGSGQNSVDIG